MASLPRLHCSRSKGNIIATITSGTKHTFDFTTLMKAIDDNASSNVDFDITNARNFELLHLEGLFELNLIDVPLKTFDGIKMDISNLHIIGCDWLTSFKGLHTAKVKHIHLDRNHLFTSISNCSRDLPKTLETMTLIFDPRCGILSLFKLPNFHALISDGNPLTEFYVATTIINRHLKGPERDFIECQEELLDNDLDLYAKL